MIFKIIITLLFAIIARAYSGWLEGTIVILVLVAREIFDSTEDSDKLK